MREAIHEGGKLVVGEVYYTQSDVPPELVEYEGHWHTEPELYEIAREEGFEVGYVARATVDDWDRYASNCIAEVDEIKAAQDPGERRERQERLHRWQDMCIHYRREFQRWAIYVLCPLSSGILDRACSWQGNEHGEGRSPTVRDSGRGCVCPPAHRSGRGDPQDR